MIETVYIAGPMRGVPDHNHRAFNRAARELRGTGFSVVNPAEIGSAFGTPEKLDAEPALLKACMDFELERLRTCDAIYLLPGWERSEGALRELANALGYGLRVIVAPVPAGRAAP